MTRAKEGPCLLSAGYTVGAIAGRNVAPDTHRGSSARADCRRSEQRQARRHRVPLVVGSGPPCQPFPDKANLFQCFVAKFPSASVPIVKHIRATPAPAGRPRRGGTALEPARDASNWDSRASSQVAGLSNELRRPLWHIYSADLLILSLLYSSRFHALAVSTQDRCFL